MENKLQTEVVELPSKGLLYSKENPLSSGKVEIYYMTAKHEDILTNQSYLKDGTVLDKLIKALIAPPTNYNDLLSIDRDAVMIACRILGYGKDYNFTYKGEKHSFDLTDLKEKEFDISMVTEGENNFEYTLPTSGKKVTFKMLTVQDEKDIEREVKALEKITKQTSDLSTRLKYIITSVDGDDSKKTVREFVDRELRAIDSKALRNYIKRVQPGIEWEIDLSLEEETVKFRLPIGTELFWPE